MNADRLDREVRNAAAHVAHGEAVAAAARVRDERRAARNARRHVRVMAGWGRNRPAISDAGTAAWALLLCAPGLLLSLIFTVKILGAVAALTATVGGAS